MFVFRSRQGDLIKIIWVRTLSGIALTGRLGLELCEDQGDGQDQPS